MHSFRIYRIIGSTATVSLSVHFPSPTSCAIDPDALLTRSQRINFPWFCMSSRGSSPTSGYDSDCHEETQAPTTKKSPLDETETPKVIEFPELPKDVKKQQKFLSLGKYTGIIKRRKIACNSFEAPTGPDAPSWKIPGQIDAGQSGASLGKKSSTVTTVSTRNSTAVPIKSSQGSPHRLLQQSHRVITGHNMRSLRGVKLGAS